MNLCRNSQLRHAKPSLSDSLILLTLDGEYNQHDVEHLLRLFSSLRTSAVCAIFSEPIFNVPKLVEKHHCANLMQTMVTLNMPLRALKVCGHRYFFGYCVQNYTLMWKRLMAPELNHYQGMLIGLISCLPALDTLRFNAQSVDGINKSTLAIVDTNIGPENIDRLQCLRVQSL
ncbi:hypothetical protein GGI08_004846 [Coemansia sp. S2]|nr:hypothetical protein GGI08_004846 [Coemansia sp. S2]